MHNGVKKYGYMGAGRGAGGQRAGAELKEIGLSAEIRFRRSHSAHMLCPSLTSERARLHRQVAFY